MSDQIVTTPPAAIVTPLIMITRQVRFGDCYVVDVMLH